MITGYGFSFGFRPFGCYQNTWFRHVWRFDTCKECDEFSYKFPRYWPFDYGYFVYTEFDDERDEKNKK